MINLAAILHLCATGLQRLLESLRCYSPESGLHIATILDRDFGRPKHLTPNAAIHSCASCMKLSRCNQTSGCQLSGPFPQLDQDSQGGSHSLKLTNRVNVDGAAQKTRKATICIWVCVNICKLTPTLCERSAFAICYCRNDLDSHDTVPIGYSIESWVV